MDILNYIGFTNYYDNIEIDENERYCNYSSQNYDNVSITYTTQEKSYRDISEDQEFGLVGLRNYKNVCYMNTILQCLKNIHPLVDFFINQYKNGPGEISNNFQCILSKLLYKKSNTSANSLKLSMEKYDDYFKGIEFKDSFNFYVSLLSMLHKELNKNQINKNYNINSYNKTSEDNFLKKQKEFFTKNNSIIINIFYGFQKNIFFCHNCNIKREKFQAFNFLDFSIKNGELKIKDLEDCFKTYQREEKLEIECENCKKSKLNVKYEILSLPKVLVITFKKGDHIKHKVKFPEKLDMSQIIENKEEKNKQYNLIGFINHQEENSNNVNNSHNYCITKNMFNNKWYLFSDITIYEIDKFQQFLDDTILLVYQLSGIEMPPDCLNKLKNTIQKYNEINK